MTESITIFIPAAGLGERLLPITNHIPKPLLPIAGKPILQLVLEKISGLPVTNFGINLHHKKEILEEWLSRSDFHDKITLFHETSLLGTGGALKNAENFLSNGDFLVHNADILSGIDLMRLLDFHRSSGNLATLAVHDHPKFNTVSIDSDGFLLDVGKSSLKNMKEKLVAFTGIAVYCPEFLKFLPGGASSVVDAWLAATASGLRIGTWDVSGCYWSDIGSPSAYASAVFEHMRSEGETVFIHPASEGCRNARMDGYVILEEKSIIGENTVVGNCIALPDADIAENSSYENCIIGPDFVIPLSEREIMQSQGNAANIFLIGSGGSDRRYYRVREKQGSTVLMQFSGDNIDFERHMTYTEFFRRCGIPVPALLKVDEDRVEAVFEDLGDLSLYSWLKCPRPEEAIESIYKKVLDIAVRFHTEATGHISDCPLLSKRIFDYDHLRWETNYFMENFVARLRYRKATDSSMLDGEFHNLALKVDSFPKTIIHRDFQSQNIMITKGEVPRVIDYQGARIGPPAYDIASLLWDPYYRLEDALRGRLMDYYIHCMKEADKRGFSEEAFKQSLLLCRLQRHMQALGAYGFLSLVKGKRYFLKHVKEGLRLLKEDSVLAKDKYPAIFELIDNVD